MTAAAASPIAMSFIDLKYDNSCSLSIDAFVDWETVLCKEGFVFSLGHGFCLFLDLQTPPTWV